jgi:hypothetical protein
MACCCVSWFLLAALCVCACFICWSLGGEGERDGEGCEERERPREGQRRKIFGGWIFRLVEGEGGPCVVFIEGAPLAGLNTFVKVKICMRVDKPCLSMGKHKS